MSTEALQNGREMAGRFLLVRRLGGGGMGTVWQARDRELGTEVALKFLRPGLAGDPARVEMLKAECLNARRLQHPRIVRMHDFHRDGDCAFISMAFVDGETLRERLGQVGRFDWPEAVEMILPVADALAVAHQEGIVHRDVKSGNILLDRRGRAHLTDFGIAGVLEGTAEFVTGGGSRYHVSPQQLDGLPPDPADDLYALGTLIHELLAGAPPLHPAITPERVRNEVPLPVVGGGGEPVPDDLRRLVAEMLAKEPARRPAEMRTVCRRLESLLEDTVPPAMVRSVAGPVAVTPPAQPPVAPAAPRRRRSGAVPEKRTRRAWPAAFLLALIIACGAALIAHLSKSPLILQPPDTSREAAVPPSGPKNTGGTGDPRTDDGDARRALATWEARLAALDAGEVAEWDPAGYAGAKRLGEQGDAALAAGDLPLARERYTAATAAADRLLAAGESLLAGAMAEGRRALAAFDGQGALARFETALKIAPQNTEAAAGRQRAIRLRDAQRRFAAGRRHEEAGRAALALADYEAARESEPALPGLAGRVDAMRERIAADLYRRQLSAGLAAFHGGDLKTAAGLLEGASRLRPDAPELRDARMQLAAAQEAEKLREWLQKAAGHAAAENWAAARDAYREALKIDPGVAAAQVGRDRSRRELELSRRLDFYLGDPSRLEADHHLAGAESLLAVLSGAPPGGAKRRQKVETLAGKARAARSPVALTLISDNATDVTVYRVGRLGRFTARNLDLRPGTYTVVGARDGYRDVRRRLRLRPGQTGARIQIVCSERVDAAIQGSN